MEQNLTYEELSEKVKVLEAELEEKKRRERRFYSDLKIGEKRFLDLIEKNADAIIVIDGDGIVQYANPACEALFGREREGFQGKVFGFPVISGESTELHIPQKRGMIRTAEMLVRDTIWDGRKCSLATMRDITERKRAEESLESSEEKYRKLVESAMDAIVIAQEGYHKFASSKIETLTGYTSEEFKKIYYLEFIHPEDRSMVQEMYEKRIKGDGAKKGYTCRILTKSGETRWMQINSSLLEWEGKPASLAFLRDITEQRNLEAQFQQAQKMEAVGTLAGGVAHDFNNLLTTILGNIDLSLMHLNKDDPLRELLEEVKKAGQSASSLTRHLLAFSRKQIIHPVIIDLNQILKDMGKMLKRLIGEDIEMETHLASDLDMVKVDPGQVEQVIMNLAVNSRDAMPSGGKLILETGNIYLDGNYFRDHGVEALPGNYVVLAVSDTGVGIDDKTRSRIFEPFFTTKEKGKGTGLGLSTVYGIIKQASGFIWVYSEPGKGSTFKIYLPAAVDEDVKIVEREKTDKPLEGFETVLLVEDDKGLLKLARKILKSYGYRVLEADNGEEALEVSKGYKATIHILVTDIVMPRMNGIELAEHIKTVRPSIKILYMSGYTDTRIIDRNMLDPGSNFIQKPFSPKGFALKVRTILDSGQDE